MLFLKPSAVWTTPKETVLRRGGAGAAKKTARGILKAHDDRLVSQLSELLVGRGHRLYWPRCWIELADDSCSVAGEAHADPAPHMCCTLTQHLIHSQSTASVAAAEQLKSAKRT